MPALSMPRLWAMLLSGSSVACGFAALGVALYAGSPVMLAAAKIFASVGFATGIVCALVPAWIDGLPASARLPAGRPAADGRSALNALAQLTTAVQHSVARPAGPVHRGPRSTSAQLAAQDTSFADTRPALWPAGQGPAHAGGVDLALEVAPDAAPPSPAAAPAPSQPVAMPVRARSTGPGLANADRQQPALQL